MKDTERETRDFYDRDAVHYDRRWLSSGGAHTSSTQRRIVGELCQKWRGKEVLEVGCGTGRFSSMLLEVAAQLTVVDLSLQMVRITKANIQRDSHLLCGGVCRGINASIYRLPFPANSFDAVLSINVFSHLESSELALGDLARVLRPRGQLVVNFANGCSYYWPAAFVVTWRRQAIAKNVFSKWRCRKEILKHLEGAGFRVIRTVGNVHIPRHVDIPLIRDAFRLLDSMSRGSVLTSWAPILFFACEKAV